MKKRILFVERQKFEAVSIERVFAQVAKSLRSELFDVEFQNLTSGHGPLAVLKALFFFRPKPADIYHITGDIHYIALRLPKHRTVLTIHDLGFLRMNTGIRRFVLKKMFLDLPVRAASYVTAISNATRDEVITNVPAAEHKIWVIENPLIDGFVSTPVKPFNAECPVILQIGTTQNKNISNLIEAVSELNCKLRIIGPLSANIVRELAEHRIVYENVASVDDVQIVEEYRRADIVSFCSTHEGFGLPIIEAQAMRKAVVTSNVAPMNDVAGDGASLVDPSDSASIRAAFFKLINNPEYRTRLVDLGTENIKRFDGKTIADQYCQLYLRILNDNLAE